MSSPISDLQQLLRSVEPFLKEGVYVFASLPHQADLSALQPIATISEAEGVSDVVEEKEARHHQLTPLFYAAWIALKVHSNLQAVGLTAAISSALGNPLVGLGVALKKIAEKAYEETNGIK